MWVQLVKACMHVTTTPQITKYSLINNSCMSVQTETQLRSDGGTVYYHLLKYSIVNIPFMLKESFPWGLRSYFFKFCEYDEANSHMWLHWTEKNYAKKLEAWRAWGRHIQCLFSLWAVLFDCRESRIAWELILFVTWTIFPLVW